MNDQLWAQLDPRRRAAVQRALNVSGAGSVLLQTNINKIVQQLTLRVLGVQSVLDHKPGSGDRAYINRRSAGTTGGAWVADTDTATEETGSYAQASFTYRTLLTRGRVTRKIQATGRTYGDVLAQELMGKSEDFANLLEEAFVSGDTTASANQPNGLLTLINAQTAQVVANSTSTSGGSLVLAKLDEAIDVVRGSGNRSDLVIFANHNGSRKLNAALQAQQQFTNVTEIGAGFRVRNYDGIPIVVTTQLGNALTWNGSNSVTAFTGGNTTALVIVNRRYTWIEDLTPITVLPLAKDTSQYDQFELYADTALVYSNTLGGAILAGVSGT